ncbi:hypothetical protein HK097_005344 [Rhizophlyctis rosea]|uniref:UBC core domain-containing protein n=1 Tax=Rhizophlyctis rosea TaxID=64517 RepID=A0AAD5SJX0_9FUNG|nr:hypothetical protein HK097_005344 [Rhizophlyctis rosea]
MPATTLKPETSPQQSQPTILPSSTRRLLRDMTELSNHPIDFNLSAYPLPENIYEWHANLRNPDTGLLLHVVLIFPPTYPLNPPKLILQTLVPHENVVRTLEGPRVCLDMLEDGQERAYEGWSASYSVRSILLQLQAFTFDPAMKFGADSAALEEALRESKGFTCSAWLNRLGLLYGEKDEKVPNSTAPAQQSEGATTSNAPTLKASEQYQSDDMDVEEGDKGWKVCHSRATKRRLKNSPPGSPLPVGHGPKKAKTGGYATAAAKAVVPTPATPPKAQKALPLQHPPTSVAALQQLNIALPTTARPSKGEYTSKVPKIPSTAARPVDVSKSGLLGTIPYEILIQTISLPNVTPRDILSLSLTNRHLHAICQDGTLWRTLLKRRHPRSQLSASRMMDWKLAFTLEANCAADEMRCFFSKASWEEDVLGLPVVWTKNPKTGKVDYVACESELVSRSAFMEGKLRRTVWNTAFTDWLPIYITEDHFRRAIPDIKDLMLKLSPHRKEQYFQPDMVLEVIPKMMNTLIVLLCDHGMAASTRAVECYFLLHRLLMALLDTYPLLRGKVNRQIEAFIQSESNRTKSATPSLGDVLPLVSFSSYSWTDPKVHNAFLGEAADRAVLWMCRDFPQLAKVPPTPGGLPRIDEHRLEKSWAAGKVSRRLLMFHCYTLWMMRKSGGVTEEDLKNANDGLFGRPPKRVVDNFQTAVKKIMAVDSWPYFYNACYLKPPSKSALTAYLEQSVRNSVRKGYHKPGMDFSKIQSRGVLKILLKGESFSAPPNLSKVVMEEAWRYDMHMKYLDASCSVYGFQNNLLDHITYANTTSGTVNNAIRHSGDVMDDATKSGKHTITINISALPAHVKSLVFCMSAWNTMLRDIRHPYVRLVSAVEDAELCKYEFKGDVGTKTSIIMCALWRKEIGGKKWECKAIGELGEGCVGRMQKVEEVMGMALQQLV